jgi:tRNA A37 threonylcarbamoyltransferase TsaD
MIAFAGLKRLEAGAAGGMAIEVRARWPLDELTVPAEVTGAGA